MINSRVIVSTLFLIVVVIVSLGLLIEAIVKGEISGNLRRQVREVEDDLDEIALHHIVVLIIISVLDIGGSLLTKSR
jgi:hypothetical protein